MEIEDDDNSDGYILELVWRGSQEYEMLTQPLDYTSDIDAFEDQIMQKINNFEEMLTFY